MFEVQIDEKTKAFFEQNIFQHLADAKLLEFGIDLFKRFVAANFAGVFVEPTAYDGLDASTLAAEAKDALSFGENRPVTSVRCVIFSNKKWRKKIRNLLLGLDFEFRVMNENFNWHCLMAPKSWAKQSKNDKKLSSIEILRLWGTTKIQKYCLKRFGAEILILIICIGVIKNHKLKKLTKYNHSSFFIT